MVVGWVVGWGEIEIKANSAQLELELGLSLTRNKIWKTVLKTMNGEQRVLRRAPEILHYIHISFTMVSKAPDI